jgi:hypothetical protein
MLHVHYEEVYVCSWLGTDSILCCPVVTVGVCIICVQQHIQPPATQHRAVPDHITVSDVITDVIPSCTILLLVTSSLLLVTVLGV